MAIDWPKLGLYAVIVAGVGSFIYLRHDFKRIQPPPPRPPVVVTVPVTPPPPAPVVVPETPVMGPKVTAPVPPKPVAKPAPQPPKKAIPPVKKRPVKKALDCSKVPQQAYEHEEETVVSFARARGVSDPDIAKLRACIHAHKTR